MRYTKIRTSNPTVLVMAVTALIIGIAAFSVSSRVVIAQMAAPSWSNAGSMSTARMWHTATQLQDGRYSSLAARSWEALGLSQPQRFTTHPLAPLPPRGET